MRIFLVRSTSRSTKTFVNALLHEDARVPLEQTWPVE